MTHNTLADEYVAEARRDLAACLVRVKHCLGQLDDGQVWRRPRPGMHSVGDLVLHLCGSLRRHFVSVVSGAADDDRDRARGVAEGGAVPKAELLLRLEEAAGAADAVLAGLTADRLLEERRYAGLRGEMKATALAVVQRTLLRCVGHAQEVVYSARLLLGEGYKFLAPAEARKRVIAADDVVFERGMLPPLPAAPPPQAPSPAQRADAEDGGLAAPGRGAPPSESPLHDHLLELEQEFQDQQAEGRL